jgi:hypothetical protein
VTDEDLLIGIGSIAWMFDISKSPEDTSILDATEPKIEFGLGMNEKATISNEELNAGVEMREATMEDKILTKYSYPGTVTTEKEKSQQPAYKPLEWGDITKKPEDPTLDYSILLIAKPIPFKFQLRPRDTNRAGKVRDLFKEGAERGDYTETREYWGPNQGRDQPLGWSKV